MGVERQEMVRQQAFQICEDDWRPEGADKRHWLQAEDELFGDDDYETMQELLKEDDYHDGVAIDGAAIAARLPDLAPAGGFHEKGAFHDKQTQRRRQGSADRVGHFTS